MAGFKISYDENKEPCREAWKDEDYLNFDGTKRKNEGKYSIRN